MKSFLKSPNQFSQTLAVPLGESLKSAVKPCSFAANNHDQQRIGVFSILRLLFKSLKIVRRPLWNCLPLSKVFSVHWLENLTAKDRISFFSFYFYMGIIMKLEVWNISETASSNSCCIKDLILLFPAKLVAKGSVCLFNNCILECKSFKMDHTG